MYIASSMLVILLLLFTGVCQSLKQPCILVPLLIDSSNSKCQLALDTIQATSKDEVVQIIPVINEAEFDTVVEFVARAFRGMQKEHGAVTTGECSGVTGVVGDLHLSTASIIHTLSSKVNMNVTLVSAGASCLHLPPPQLTWAFVTSSI